MIQILLNYPVLTIVLASWIICGVVAVVRDPQALFIPTILSVLFLIARCFSGTNYPLK